MGISFFLGLKYFINLVVGMAVCISLLQYADADLSDKNITGLAARFIK